jgi:hypothetical protein
VEIRLDAVTPEKLGSRVPVDQGIKRFACLREMQQRVEREDREELVIVDIERQTSERRHDVRRLEVQVGLLVSVVIITMSRAIPLISRCGGQLNNVWYMSAEA